MEILQSILAFFTMLHWDVLAKVVGLPFVKLVAGAYLVYLAYSMVSNDDDDDGHGVAAKAATNQLGTQ